MTERKLEQHCSLQSYLLKAILTVMCAFLKVRFDGPMVCRQYNL